MEADVKEMLWQSNPEMRLRWKELYSLVYQKNNRLFNDEYVFKTTFIRTIKKLLQKGDLTKDPESTRKNVYYFITKNKRSKILAEIRRNYAHKKIDETWDSLTTEQQKMMIIKYENMRVEALKSVTRNIKNLEKAADTFKTIK